MSEGLSPGHGLWSASGSAGVPQESRPPLRVQIAALMSDAILLVTAWLFHQQVLSAVTLTICWSICFFFVSAGASAAYLTVSEIFPDGDQGDGDRPLQRGAVACAARAGGRVGGGAVGTAQ